jgi:acyl carrier protein
MDKTYITQKVTKIAADDLGTNERDIKPESRFIEDLGADSLDALNIVLRCEEEFEIDISDDEAEKIVTVADAVRLIETKVQEAEGSNQ